jgi:hypothetical protein
MELSSLRVSPIASGEYVAIINELFETDKYLHYSFSVDTKEGIKEVVCFINLDGKFPYRRFVKNITAFYGQKCHTEDHEGTKVFAKFEVNRDIEGNEYCNLVGYRPYIEESEETSNDAI